MIQEIQETFTVFFQPLCVVITVMFSDGSASAVFNIKEKSSGGGSSTPEKKTDNVVTCQMAGYPADYAWNEAAKACQPGYIDDNGVFHSTGNCSPTVTFSNKGPYGLGK